ncbi:MAG: lipoyl(octanoyl) transferase LipB [Desulfobacterales bacterium]|jgi:lipoate-protein ligase B|nr:lipoyl(octanoyl) transferase LipB [Deltaproteobacteria bacterium]
MKENQNIKNDAHNDHSPSIGDRATTDYGQQTTDPETWLSIDFKRIDYLEAWALQEKLLTARRADILPNDIVLFLEHPPVFTLGRRGGRECMLVSDAFLKKAGIPIIQVERGGYITYHGPGQLVVYPIVDLHTARIKVVDFVSGLEDVMLQTVQSWGIAAERNDANRGIWVGPKKMGSIGIAIRRGISFHGIALNIHTDLTPFTWIQPCGLQDVQMTSIQQESEQAISMQQVRTVLKKQFEVVFGIKLIETTRDNLASILDHSTLKAGV